MGKFTFRDLSPGEFPKMLPRMFHILYTNMMAVAPSDGDYEADQTLWLGYLEPALVHGDTRVVLMLAGEELAGYFQYSIRGDTMLVEEVEIRWDYQRTMLLFRCGQFLASNLPAEIRYLESYVNKENRHSLSIHNKLGMEIIGENQSGRGWHMRGNAQTISEYFLRGKGIDKNEQAFYN